MMRIASLVSIGSLALAMTTLAPATAAAAPLTVIVSAGGPQIAGTSRAVGDFDLLLAFDPAVVVQSVTFGSQLNLGDASASFQLSDAGSAGVLEALEVSFVDFATLMSLQADAFPLLTIVFDTGALTRAAAFASVQLSRALVGDAIGNPLGAALLSINSPDVSGPTPVPEPATAAVAGVALLGVLARARRSRISNL